MKFAEKNREKAKKTVRIKRLVGMQCAVIGYCLLFYLMDCSRVVTAERFIRDADNRVMILHGVNLGQYAKTAPGHIPWHTFDDYARLVYDFGFNFIRMTIFWDGVEPEPDSYDDDYLDAIAERIEWCESLGLTVILDMHQDLYGPKFTGDGAPGWATWDDGLPFSPVSPWALNYLSPAVRRAFTNFWCVGYLQQHYAAMWAHVVERFAESPAVIGYDLINEPYFGEFGPWIFELTVLNDFYTDLARVLEAIDPDGKFFYEPEILTSAGVPSFLEPLPVAGMVYFPHYYDPAVHEGFPYNGDYRGMWQALEYRRQEAARADIPWVIGELGVAADTSGMGDYLDHLCAILDYHMVGWAYWSYDLVSHTHFGLLNDDGSERAQLDHLIRPYPQRIAGDPIRYAFNRQQRLLWLDFVNSGDIQGPTEIFIGESRWFPTGFIVVCTDEPGSWSWQYDAERGLIKVWTNSQPGWRRIVIAPAVNLSME